MKSQDSRAAALAGIALALVSFVLPAAIQGWAFALIAAVQTTVLAVVVWSRRKSTLLQPLWWVLVAACVMQGVADVAVVRAWDNPSLTTSRGVGLTAGIVALVLCVSAAGLIMRPFLGVAAMRRPSEVGLGSFAAVAVAYAWGDEQRQGVPLVALVFIVAVGAVGMVLSSVLISPALREVRRPAERYLVPAASVFAVGQVIAFVASDVPIYSRYPPSANVVAFGLIIAAALHPRAGKVGRPLYRHSDREVMRSTSWALGAVLVADGAVVALSKFGPGIGMVWWLGIAAAVQTVLLIWALAVWWESGAAREMFLHHRLGVDLRHALIHHEIVPHYQPIVRVSDGVCVGFEALARWNHPTRGLMAAGDFLPLADARGYLASIDREMLIAAASDLPSLLEPLAADEPFVTVNLSPWRLEQPGFATEIVESLRARGLSGEGLIIEMTETPAVTNWDALAENVKCLQAVGIGLAIDDFGTGHANLSLLCQLDVDMIKLDRSLVSAAMSSVRGAAVVRGAIQTAQTSGAIIVAEGVEDYDWIDELRRLGVGYVQGYGIGRPAPARLASGLTAWRN